MFIFVRKKFRFFEIVKKFWVGFKLMSVFCDSRMLFKMRNQVHSNRLYLLFRVTAIITKKHLECEILCGFLCNFFGMITVQMF